MDPLDYGSYTFLKNGPFSDSFSLFLSIQYSLQKTKVQYKFGRWLDLNHGPLVSEATALLTDPQPLPRLLLLEKFVRCFAFKFALNFTVSKDAKKLLSRRDVFVAKFTHYKLFSRLLFDYFSGKTERTNRPIWSDATIRRSRGKFKIKILKKFEFFYEQTFPFGKSRQRRLDFCSNKKFGD